jgi:hypothetical protein
MTRYTPQWLQAGSYAAGADRRLVGALWPTPASTGLVVTASSGMVLAVAPGAVAIPTPNNTGTTLCSSDATENVTIGAAPSSGNNRIDLVVALARGNDLDGGANNDFVLQVVAGVVAASPVAPAIPAGAVALAQVYVGGGVAAIVQGNITDRRPWSLLAPMQARPWGVAWGLLARTRNTTTPQANIAAAVDLTGLSVSVTTPANRVLGVRMSATFQLTTASTGDVFGILLMRDGVEFNGGRGGAQFPSGSRDTPLGAFAYDDACPAGTHTYKAQGARIGGAGGIWTMQADAAGRPASFWVEDLGPVPGTTPPAN